MMLSGTVIWPASAPNYRRAPGGFSGTSLQAGCLPRARMISSPASARATSWERVVLAAWMVTGDSAFMGGI